MYLWVIIVAFLAALATLGTSLRSDIKEVYVEPQAEVVISKLFIQHRGLLKYALEPEHGEEDKLQPGSWSVEGHTAYFPYGFRPGSFTSKIYCLDSNGQLPEQCRSDYEGADHVDNCCQVPDRVLYLMTYGKIPPKWRDKKTKLPRPELLNAMRHSGGYTDGMGYFDSRENVVSFCQGLQCMHYTETIWGIYSQANRQFYGIPDYIVENDGGFRRDCISTSSGSSSSNYCLMYVSKY